MNDPLKNFFTRRPRIIKVLRTLAVMVSLTYLTISMMIISTLNNPENYSVVEATAETATIFGEPVEFNENTHIPVEMPSGYTISLEAIEAPLPIGSEITVWSAEIPDDAAGDADTVVYPKDSERAYALEEFSAIVEQPFSNTAVLWFAATSVLWVLVAFTFLITARMLKKTTELPYDFGYGFSHGPDGLAAAIWEPFWPLTPYALMMIAMPTWITMALYGAAGYGAWTGGDTFKAAMAFMLVGFLGLGGCYLSHLLVQVLAYFLTWGNPGKLPADFAWRNREDLLAVNIFLKFKRLDFETMETLAENSEITFKDLIKTSKILGPTKA